MSADGIKNNCNFFGNCGGCKYYEYYYSLEMKEKYLNQLFGKKIKLNESKKILKYRNRMDFIYFNNMIGLRKRGKWNEVVDIKECNIFEDKGNKILKILREKIIDQIAYYDIINKKGYLNYIVIRVGSDEVLVNFVVKEKKIDQNFLEIINDLKIDSVYVQYNPTKSDISYGDTIYNLGKKYITIKLKNKKYFIGPTTFFQTNRFDIIYPLDIIKEYVFGDVVDLFCGVGTIGIYVAENCKSVIGYELNQESVHLSEKIIEINKVDNVKIYQGNVKEINIPKGDVLIVDPNRPGLSKKLINRILKNNYKRIIYMSCNPKTQKEDLKLLKKEYKIIFHEAYDLFPFTNHCEILCILDKKY